MEQREIIRLGSNTPIPIDVKIIAATNKDLEELIGNNMFREDLYYRLNVIPFQIPPLRERKEDVKVMTNNFTIKYSKLFKKQNIINLARKLLYNKDRILNHKRRKCID